MNPKKIHDTIARLMQETNSTLKTVRMIEATVGAFFDAADGRVGR
jgi:hypothetical protein